MQTVQFLLYSPILKSYCNQNPCWKKYKLCYPKFIDSAKSSKIKKSKSTKVNSPDLLTLPEPVLMPLANPTLIRLTHLANHVQHRWHHLPSTDAKTSGMSS